MRYLKAGTDEERWEIMKEIMELRADYLLRHAFSGFKMSLNKAKYILSHEDGLTADEKAARRVLFAALDNLADFAVAEEYQMMKNFPADGGKTDDEDDDTEYTEVFQKYNSAYADTEDMDVEDAMRIALLMYGVTDGTVFTYMTQGDDRVRPWHLQYEGYSAPKGYFPEWLVPPIEHGCRCFLIEDSVFGASKASDVKAEIHVEPTMPYWFNRTFKECVGMGGRIFSDEHPYFNVNSADFEKLKVVSDSIEEKYLTPEDDEKDNT